MLQERRDAILKGKTIGTMDEHHLTEASRDILQLHKPLAVNIKAGRSIGPTGAGLQARYVEQWLNDVLRDAQDMKYPGVLTHPEKALPINRYEIDKISLTNLGIPIATVDRIYRALFVHSVGFH